MKQFDIDEFKKAIVPIAEKKFRLQCQPPCDSYGVCENCIEMTLIKVGIEMAVKHANEILNRDGNEQK